MAIIAIILTLIITSATAFTFRASSATNFMVYSMQPRGRRLRQHFSRSETYQKIWTGINAFALPALIILVKILHQFALFCFKLGQMAASALRERYGVSIADLSRFEISLDSEEWRNRLNQGVSVVQESVATVQSQFQVAIVGPQKPTTHLDMFEDTANNMITVQLDLPGIPKQDIEMSIIDGLLSIVTRRQQAPHPEGTEIQYLIQTRVYGEFEEKIKLPVGTKKEDLTAFMEDGVLIVTFPRVSVHEVEKITVL